MDIEDQKARPQLRSHTTLRTLLAATAVAAMWAGLSPVFPAFLVHWLITPIAVCFVCGLLGVGLLAGFAIGFATALAVEVFPIAMADVSVMRLESAVSHAFFGGLIAAWLMGLTWITASWWGLYLRYAWSNRVWPPIMDDDGGVLFGNSPSAVRDRLIARCAETPGAFVVVSILAHVFVYIAYWWMFVVVAR
jgi:hypothetical protein